MKKIFMVALAAVAVCLSAKAEVNKYTLSVGEFTKLKVYDNIDLTYKCLPDSAGLVSFVADDRFAEAFLFTCKNGTLKVQAHTEFNVIRDELPAVTVYSSFLSTVENNSEGDVEVLNVAPCPDFQVKQVGNGTIRAFNLEATNVKAKIATGKGLITISGTATQADYDMLGTGVIQADELETNVVKCKVFGTGSIACYPISELNVKGLASTTIYYKGSPATIKKTGFAKIEKMP